MINAPIGPSGNVALTSRLRVGCGSDRTRSARAIIGSTTSDSARTLTSVIVNTDAGSTPVAAISARRSRAYCAPKAFGSP